MLPTILFYDSYFMLTSIYLFLINRKFNTKKTPELLDAIDAYIHFNASTDAGLLWPGYFEVDTVSPGKIWKAKLRDLHLERKKNRKNKHTGATVSGR